MYLNVQKTLTREKLGIKFSNDHDIFSYDTAEVFSIIKVYTKILVIFHLQNNLQIFEILTYFLKKINFFIDILLRFLLSIITQKKPEYFDILIFCVKIRVSPLLFFRFPDVFEKYSKILTFDLYNVPRILKLPSETTFEVQKKHTIVKSIHSLLRSESKNDSSGEASLLVQV
ncbi:hypothetical protein AGLY_013123 [Aphis glycines]|uniref:Uncharacterized protein n=1 Tax=Aphis glycines TaxID=307491 RepID=A0A6G0T7K1_APHGL|nr:hypothetical protein AGLY_013123 [Aphis glycines]